MSDGVRSVRATPQFFHDLDDQFFAERGPNGEPSAHDFLVVELFRVIERFASGFDELLLVNEHDPGHRMLVTAGRLVPFFVITGRLASDGAVELVSLDVDSGL